MIKTHCIGIAFTITLSDEQLSAFRNRRVHEDVTHIGIGQVLRSIDGVNELIQTADGGFLVTIDHQFNTNITLNIIEQSIDHFIENGSPKIVDPN